MDSASLLDPRFEVEVEHVMIPTRDGTRLGANLFLPRGAGQARKGSGNRRDDGAGRVPVVVEYTPYRKDDFRGASRDFGSFYFAERGIAAVQLDVRGTGASEGFVLDEYQYPQEQQDGYDALEWLAAQEWCNGKTGLWGTSYAGFTAFQVAQIHPPSLAAIAPIYATDDRYTDDMHFRGGALNGWSVIGSYALGMVTRNALPPYPEHFPGDWMAAWDLRLRENIPWLIRWIEEQLDGPYWRSTLAREYEKVHVPTLIIGGWADFYVNASLRWFEHLRVPKKLIMGPWPHTPPDVAVPGPRINFLHEITRWWVLWLVGEPTGILDEPPVTVFIQEYRRPDANPGVAPGFWRFEETVPPEDSEQGAWFFASDGRLAETVPEIPSIAYRDYVPFVGFADLGFAGSQTGWGEQGAQEAFSMVFTSDPLGEELEILGFPRVVLFASASAETACFAVRLSDVDPDGASTLVTKALLNVTRRAGMNRTDSLVPGEVYRLEFDLDAISWIFSAGHRIRVAVSGADFPEVWPTPHPATLRVQTGNDYPSAITLPVMPAKRAQFAMAQPKLLPPPARRSRFTHKVAGPVTSITYEVATRALVTRRELFETVRNPDGATRVTSEHHVEMRVPARDPAAAAATARDRRTLRRPGFEVESTATALLRGREHTFELELELEVSLNGTRRWDQRWKREIGRSHL